MPDLYNKKPLSDGDALFLYFEREGQPINVASVSVFEGEIPLQLCADFIESKLPLIPRYRQRVVAPPWNIDLPAWEYDPNFDIRNHVRELTLRHGTEAEFKTVAAKILSTRMDRERPLWDFTLLRGLKGNRTGAIVRMHHCLVDGVSGVGVLNVLLDPSPVPQPVPKVVHRSPAAQASTAGTSLLEGFITSCISAAQRVIAAESEMLALTKQAIAAAERRVEPAEVPESAQKSEAPIPSVDVLTRLLPSFVSATDRLPFNVVCRGPQLFNWAELPLAEIKAVKEACGATVNDVILTVYTMAIRRYVKLHRVPLEGRMVRVVVPVNLRAEGDVSDLGNRITFLPINVPLDIADPRKLIDAVREAMARSRTAHMAELVGLLGTVLATIPPALRALVGPVVSQLPLSLCNTICTNVPGPKVPLYLLGHKLLSCYPYVPIGGEMGMNCAILTYDGTAYFGFSGDAHAIPDLARLDKLLTTSFADLRKAAGVRAPRRKRVRSKSQSIRRTAQTSTVSEPPVVPDAISSPTEPAAASEGKAEPEAGLPQAVGA